MKKFIQIQNLFIMLSFVGVIHAQQIFINEIMSSNGVTIPDEDGDYSDWIEIYNDESTAVDLSGYGLSDHASEP